MFAATTALAQLGELLGKISALETRLVVSLAVLVFTLALAKFLLPPTIRYLDFLLTEELFDGRIGATVNPVSRYIPTTLSGVALRLTQFAILVSATVMVLTVWGRYDVVEGVITAINDSEKLLWQIATSAILVSITYVGTNLLKDTIRDLSGQTDWMTEHQEEILLRVSQLGLFLGIGLVFLFVWEVQLGGVLVGAGFLGIIVGLAARQALSSMLAGFLLMFSRPFTIGDWVEIGDKEGMVTEITIFNTRIETFDGEMVVLPNDKVSEKPIVNRSSNGLLRVRVDVSIGYDSDPERAAEIAADAIKDIRAVADTPSPDVYPVEFASSSIVLEMRFWIDLPTPPRKMKATAAVINEVKKRFANEGIEIPYPHRTVTEPNGREAFRVHGQGERTSSQEDVSDGTERSTRHD